MAKGLRASRMKKNNQALSKRVFGPVEAARNERLSAKLLELARQPKAPKEEMEIEQDSAKKDSGATAEGTPSLSIPIPPNFGLCDNIDDQLLTPPSTPPSTDGMPATPILDRAGQLAMAREQLFFHLLGASSDILGFDLDGSLRLEPLKHRIWKRKAKNKEADSRPFGARSADPDAMQDDDANGAPLTRTTTQERSITKQKADRALKKSKIEKRKAKPKPQNAMTFNGRNKTRKGGR
ncbi:hypothetical protein Q7P37_005128 [Cladosporium fusiforme]